LTNQQSTAQLLAAAPTQLDSTRLPQEHVAGRQPPAGIHGNCCRRCSCCCRRWHKPVAGRCGTDELAGRLFRGACPTIAAACNLLPGRADIHSLLHQRTNVTLAVRSCCLSASRQEVPTRWRRCDPRTPSNALAWLAHQLARPCGPGARPPRTPHHTNKDDFPCGSGPQLMRMLHPSCREPIPAQLPRGHDMPAPAGFEAPSRGACHSVRRDQGRHPALIRRLPCRAP